MKKKILLVLISCLLIVSLAACGSSKSADYAVDDSLGYPDPNGSAAESEGSSYDAGSSVGTATATVGIDVPQHGLKIIYNASLNAETKDFDASLEALLAAVKAAGGYVSNSDRSGGYYSGDYYRSKSANIQCRIPSEGYGDFLATVGETVNVTSSNEYTEDITSQYIDLEARLKSLYAQEEQYMALLERAVTVEDIMTVSSALTDVRYQIESYTMQKNTFDDLVSFSTISIYLSEVSDFTPAKDTFGQRIAAAFKGSGRSVINFLDGLVIVLIYVLPYLVIAALVTWGIVALVRRRRAKKALRGPAAPRNDTKQ